MLANILTTIILAIGIATGNVSSNSYKGGNAFNYEEQKERPQPKRAGNENITFTYDVAHIQTSGDTEREYFSKFYLEKDNNPSTIINETTYNIYNTIYAYKWEESPRAYYRSICILQMTTYFNFSPTELTINNHVTASNIYNESIFITYSLDNFITTDDISQYIDMSTVTSARYTLNNYINNATKLEEYTHNDELGTVSNYDQYLDNEYTITTIRENTTVNIVMVATISTTQNHMAYSRGGIIPNTLTVDAMAYVPTINYEVVDIPSLMFTILTMPFSFISTAFNLTIFPGTPYALNFGNLVYTIIAAFILLYILKKIFK